MRRFSTLAAVAVLLTAPTAPAQEPTQQWTPLFNGKDLAGWKTNPGQRGQWKVVDGAIVGGGDATSHLFTDRGDFDSFHIRVEARVGPGGNSGVFFCSEFGLSRPGGYPAGYEAQICPAGTREHQLTGSLFGMAPVKEDLVGPGRWFTLEVTKDGRFIDIKVDGRTAARYKDEEYTYTKGHFALQQIAGTTVAFRRVDVLEPCPAQYRVGPTEETVPLITYWSEERNEIATVSTPAMKRTLDAAGYVGPEMTARALKTAFAGTAPLLLYESGDGREHMTVSTEAGKKTAEDAGYKPIGEQGHAYTKPGRGTVPLNLYWNPDRKDYFTCSSEYPRDRPERQGYEFVRTEGHVIPAWRNQPRPWAILLCKFSDKADFEPHPPDFYKQAYTEAGAGKGREFDYFRDVSGGALDLTGSKVFGWMTVDHTTEELRANENRAPLAWAREAARAKGIDLTPFWSVAVFTNHNKYGGAFGPNGHPMSVLIDWNPDFWGPYSVGHEFGHGFGMGHSRLARPLYDYGDRWDIMGDGWWHAKKEFPIGSGFNTFHLRQTGCLPADRIWTANPAPGGQTITLAAHNDFSADGFQMAVIPPVPGITYNHVYIIEFRCKKGWGVNIPHDTVLVYEDRNDGYPYLLSRQKGFDNVDAMETLSGQTFEVPLRDLTIKVESFDLEASTAKVTVKIDEPGKLARKLKPVTEYLIVSAQSGRVLDAATPAWLGDGVTVRLWTHTGEANQRWNVVREGKGTVTIVNVADGRLLDANVDQLDREGTDIALYGIDTKDRLNRVWKIVPLGKGDVAIVNSVSGRYLDADKDTIDRDGAKLALHGTDADGKPNRRWKLVPVARWPGTAPNLLVNGGFEDGPAFGAEDPWFELKGGSTAITGWKVTGSVLLDRVDWEHAEGEKSVLLHSPGHPGGIEQTFATTKGQRYRVSFALSANPNGGRWKKGETATAMRVGAAGHSQRFAFDCVGKMPDDMGWVMREWEFVATGDKTTLAFTTEETNRGDWHGPTLDDVWVEAVPWK